MLRQICFQFEGSSFWLSLPVSSEVSPEGPGSSRGHPSAPSSPQPCWQPPLPQEPLHMHTGKPSPPAPLLLPWPHVPHLKSPPGQRLSHMGPGVALLQLTGGQARGMVPPHLKRAEILRSSSHFPWDKFTTCRCKTLSLAFISPRGPIYSFLAALKQRLHFTSESLYCWGCRKPRNYLQCINS